MPPSLDPPSGAWRYGLALSLGLGLLPLIQGGHQVHRWWTERRGLDEAAQLETFDYPWCDPRISKVAALIDAAMPEGEPLLVTPIGGEDRTGRTRYFLFLANALYPRPVIVRQPNWASGTLVDYVQWVWFHFDLLDTDGSGLVPAGRKRLNNKLPKIRSELQRYGVTWDFQFYLDPEDPFGRAVLRQKGQPVDLGPLPGPLVEAAADTLEVDA